MTLEEAERNFEQSHIDARSQAEDGGGRKVRLFNELGVEEVRRNTFIFACKVLDPRVVFLTGEEPDLPADRRSELAALKNLSLMLQVLRAGVAYQEAKARAETA